MLDITDEHRSTIKNLYLVGGFDKNKADSLSAAAYQKIYNKKSDADWDVNIFNGRISRF